MLVAPHKLFQHALDAQYAMGAFNTSNLEITQAIIAAAQAQQSPVIVQTSEGAIDYAGLPQIAGIITSLANAAKVPVVMHLDHGKSLKMIQQCIETGYTSVMIDASKKDLLENIRITKEVVEYAHDHGVWVEAELGAILGAEGARTLAGGQTPDDLLTDPKQARQFVAETGVDALAVSVGTIHGAFTGQEYVRFELLEELERIVPAIPLVIHGASGLAADSLAKMAVTHVCKINIDTEVRIAAEVAIKAYFDMAHDIADYRDILGPAREAVQAVVEEKMRLFRSAGKAKS
jgi:fructose-bisphosphate aldolase class II